MKKTFVAAFCACSCLSLAQSIIPLPRQMTRGAGEYFIGTGTSIQADSASAQAAEMLRDVMKASTGYALPLGTRGSSAIHLSIDPALKGLGPEGYRLTVEPSGVRITSAGPAGVFYGTETLLQLLPPQIYRKSRADGVRWAIPSVSIEDSPRFGWRGSLMDVSRHFEPKEFVLKFLDLLAMHKLNVFHWHLTDDNGWRVEIKRYPKLTEVGSKRDFSQMNPDNATRSINTPIGGFYTQDDIREVVRYAAARNITIVPEIEMPGHSAAAIASYPELGNLYDIKAAGGDTSFMGDFDNVYNVNDSTIHFLQNVLDEIMDLFPSKFIHIGGDEVWKDPWKHNPKAQQRMKDLGLKNEDELQSWFIKQMDTYLTSKGRRLIGWDEILEGGLAPNAAVMSWRGIDGGIAAAKAGHDVVMAPTDHTYLDYYQSRITTHEPKGAGSYLPLSTVYEFEPIPAALNSEEAKHVLGCQAQLWSEFIPHPKHMEYMAYPRLCALAEVAWSPKESRNWSDFSARLSMHLQRLDVLDVHYRPPTDSLTPPIGGWKSGEIGETWMEREWEVKPAKVGTYEVTFAYSEGASRLDISKVELLRNGEVMSADEHAGTTGGGSKANTYRVKVDALDPKAKWVLRARVRADGSNDSNGDIFFIPA